VEAYVNGIIAQQLHPQQSTTDEPPSIHSSPATSSTSSSSLKLSSTMKIFVIRDATITNDGDALREMEKRNVIQSDPFVLMYADTITNVSLPDKIKLYQQYRTTIDTSTISMMLFKSIGLSSPLHPTNARSVIVGFNNNNNNNTAIATTSSSTNTSASDDTTTMSTTNTTNECHRILLYDHNTSRKNHIQVPCSFMNQICNDLVIRTDLYDTGIDICSPELLVRFSDEFDYQNIRNEFVTNTVAEEEMGLQQSIYGCIVADTEYSARIHDLRIYHQISNDILRRFVYPMVPDNIAISSSHPYPPWRYSVQHHFMYHPHEALVYPHHNSTRNNNNGKTKTTRIGRTSIVTGPGLIGHNCHIDEHCCIRSSVIGHSCAISDHCHISHSHIWENTIIESNVTIHQSIIASHVIIKSGVTIPRGCIIGSGCIIGTNIKLSEFTRLTCTKPDDENGGNMDDNNEDWDGIDPTDDNDDDGDDDDDNDAFRNEGTIQNKMSVDDEEIDDFVSDADVVGPDGKGRVWQPPITDNDDDDDDDNDAPMKENTTPITTMNDSAIQSQCIGCSNATLHTIRLQQQHNYDDDNDSFSDEDEYGDHDMGNRPYDDDDDDDFGDDDRVTFGEPTSAPATTNTMIIGRQDGVDVVKELKLICLEYEGGSMDNLGIELNSYKFSQNATYADCTMAAIMALIEKLHITSKMSDGKLISEFKVSLELWSSLLHKMCIGIDEEKAIVLGLERCAIGDDDNNDDTVNDGEETWSSNSNEQVMKLSSGMSFRLLLQTLHDEEIVSEEAILWWAQERRHHETAVVPSGTTTTTHRTTRMEKRRRELFRLPPVQDFIEWLEDGDDEDDDDDEDEEEEEE
jgi:translation initiation factor eIF-2B subunit epsilon